MSVRRSPLRSVVAAGLLAVLGVAPGFVVTGPAQAGVGAPSSGAVRPVAHAAAEVGSRSATVSVDALRTTGARTDVMVRKLRRTAQARWVDHVVDERLVAIDGCLADPSRFTFRAGVYRSHVNTVCPGGLVPARRAAARLVADRPWYQVRVRAVPVVAFTMQADLEVGRGEPFAAAMRHLPRRDFTYVEGDDVWMVYVGTGVTQVQLDAARAAFAAELGIGVGRVEVAPLRLG